MKMNQKTEKVNRENLQAFAIKDFNLSCLWAAVC